MSKQATLQLTHDGRSNVLRICRGAVPGAMSVVVDFCKHLPTNKHVADIDRLNRLSMTHNRFAQSKDFICSHSNCTYHHQAESRYILHARSHFDFEVTPDAVYDTEFKWRNGYYVCSKCPRSTVDWISFREHIRHHILEKPYRCSLCMISVTCVRELRIHFQEYHLGEQADFLFNGSVYELNTLLSTLLPESSAVTEAVNIMLKVPSYMRTRIACTSALDKTQPIGLIRDLIDDSPRKPGAQQQKSNRNAFDKSHPVDFVRDLDDKQSNPSARQQESDRSAFLDDTPVVQQMPGKYEYSHGMYKCITCCYKTVKEKVFARHAWKHVHGSWKNTCAHNTKSAASSECAIVNGLLELLKRVDLNSVVANSRKDSVYETESSAITQTSESVENISSIVSAENSDNCLSQPDVVNTLQPSVTVETDFPVHDTESDQEVDVSKKPETPDSDEKVVIRHDELPLKAHCKHCSFTCNDASQLALHMKTGHNSVPCKPGNFKCPECNMSLPRKEVFFWHLSHHTGKHRVTYYACSGCDAEKPNAVELQKHIARKHVGEHLRCTPVALVENVRYLQNIMKCPVCTDGLLWKQIFIKHIQDKHDLSDLASYLNVNYGDDCPAVLSFPSHLLKSSAKNTAESVTDVVKSFRTSRENRFHRDKHEFSTSDSDACSQHASSQARTESSEEDAMSALSSNVLFDREKPHRTAKMKAYSRIITPPLLQQQNKSPKRKLHKLRQQPVARKRTATHSEARSEENNWNSVNRTKNAAVASKKVVKKPTSVNDDDFFTEFISKLPSSFVFAEDVKCPRCYFVSRVRVNLLRHLNSHMTADSKTADSAAGSSGSNDRLSYGLWQPDSSVPGEKSAEEEPVETVMSEVRNAGDNESTLTSANSTDDATEEQLTTAEIDSLSQSESDIADDGGDNMPVQTEMLACETCSSQFDTEVDLKRHISVSHGGPYVCHLCGILMWQQNVVRAHYSARHPGSPLLFETLQRKAVDSSREVGGVSEKKIARVQGIMKETQLAEFDTTPDASSQQKEPDACDVVTDTGMLPSSSSVVSVASSTSVTSVSEVSDAPTTAAPVSSFAVTSATSQVPLNASSNLSATSTTLAPSTLPVALESLLATLGNMESIAMIAAQLVPMLANLDARLLMQMLQFANPALATALSAYCTPPAAASDLGQVPAASCQTESSAMQFQLPSSTNVAFSSGMVQNQTSVCDSSAGQPVAASQSADCNRTTSCDSFQSNINSSESSGLAVGDTAVLPDTAPSESQFERRSASSSPHALRRPQSTGSTSSSVYSTDRQLEKPHVVPPVGPVVYNCHLCSFRSSHKTRFAEHLSSEFCTKNIMAMSKRTLDGASSRRKRCSHCSFSTYLSEEFDEHVRIHMSSDLRCCTYCDYVAPTTGALKLHFKQNHQKKLFPKNLVGQKSQGDRHSDDQSNMPLPQSIHLDPVVELYNVVSLDRSDIKRLKNQYGVAKINLCDL